MSRIEEKIINGKLYKNKPEYRFKSKAQALKVKKQYKDEGHYAQIIQSGGFYKVFVRLRASIYIKKPYEKRKTSEQQAKRKLSGTKIEKTVMQHLYSILPKEYKIKWNPQEGMDLIAQNGKKMKIEVKSAKAQIFEKDKKGQAIARGGRFWLKQEDYLKSLFFAFVVKPVDKNLEWDKNKNVKIKYVLTKDLQKWLKKKGRFKKYKSTKIVVSDILEMKPLDPATLLKE